MPRLPAVRITAVRSVVAILALLVAGSSLAGCSSSRGVDHDLAAGAKPAAAGATPAATPTPPGLAGTPGMAPDLVVAGAPSGVKAKEAVLADAETGQILWNRAMDTEQPMASITKVMTAYLVISGGNLDREITVPKGVLDYVAKWGASSDGLKPGEVLSVQELLDGLLLESGADSAYTLATVYGPGIPAFVAKMNATARQLGMLHTQFTSPDGLPYPTETSTYSTPADLLLLGQAAMRSPVFRSIVDQRFISLPKAAGHAAHWWGNSNHLIGTYPGANGIKTGYTDVALHCLLF
jgi:D-alanyl-D-alanine carboxypeptidase (penicillin-binding protein 5/6)